MDKNDFKIALTALVIIMMVISLFALMRDRADINDLEKRVGYLESEIEALTDYEDDIEDECPDDSYYYNIDDIDYGYIED